VVNTLGKTADGILGNMSSNVPKPIGPNAKAQAWLDRYKKRYNHDIDNGSYGMYAGIMMWAAAAEAVGDVYDFKAINKHIKTAPYKGVLWNMVIGENNTIHPQLGAPMTHYQVQNGQLITIYTDPPVKPYLDYKFIKPRWIK
jgi:branched-chain amino acid transport system substrate-binding protein